MGNFEVTFFDFEVYLFEVNNSNRNIEQIKNCSPLGHSNIGYVLLFQHCVTLLGAIQIIRDALLGYYFLSIHITKYELLNLLVGL